MVQSAPFSGLALIIDEDDSRRRSLRAALEELGHRVKEAANGTDAIGLLARRDYDLVLADWCLSDGLRGEHIARLVRSRIGGEHVLLIAINQDLFSPMADGADAPDARLGEKPGVAALQDCIVDARRLRAPQPPEALRVLRAMHTYSAVFPGGTTGALRHCRDEIIAEQRNLREAVEREQWRDAARAAHNLGSLGAMTGLAALHDDARAAEAALRGADTRTIFPMLEATRQSVETAGRTLSALIG